MKWITSLALVGISLGLAGCAYRPIVDPKRSDMARYETDLAECRQIAEQAPGPATGPRWAPPSGRASARCSRAPRARGTRITELAAAPSSAQPAERATGRAISARSSGTA